MKLKTDWIKRNLGLVIGGVVALGLMGFAGYFLYSKYQEDQSITEQLDTATTSYGQLTQGPLLPGDGKVDNIALAKQEVNRLGEFGLRVKAHIISPDIPKDLSNKDFRALLDNTIAELQREAERRGINLPGGKDYWFTFAAQRNAVEFKPLDALAYQLMDIKAITEILYTAKIHDLIAIKRVAVASEDSGSDYLEKKATTNDFAIITPYEVTFQGFSPELARVLDGFVKARQCLIVKSMAVDKAPAPPPPVPAQPGPGMMSSPYNRYGGMSSAASRYSSRPMMPMPVPQAPRPPQGLVDILDENKLRFTLVINSVRLKEEETSKKKPGVPAAPAAPAASGG